MFKSLKKFNVNIRLLANRLYLNFLFINKIWYLRFFKKKHLALAIFLFLLLFLKFRIFYFGLSIIINRLNFSNIFRTIKVIRGLQYYNIPFFIFLVEFSFSAYI